MQSSLPLGNSELERARVGIATTSLTLLLVMLLRKNSRFLALEIANGMGLKSSADIAAQEQRRLRSYQKPFHEDLYSPRGENHITCY